MSPDQITALARHTLEAAFWIAAPILVIATAVSVLISVLQVMTSVQDQAVSTIPRLVAVGVAIFLLTPWMLGRMAFFTLQLLSDFRPYAH